jgi:hypothetical protein
MSACTKTIGEIPLKTVENRYFTGEKPSNGFSPMLFPQRSNVTSNRISLHYLAGFLGAVLPMIFKPFAKLTGKRRQAFRLGLSVL